MPVVKKIWNVRVSLTNFTTKQKVNRNAIHTKAGKRVVLFFILCIVFFACNNKNDTGNTLNPENLYFDYKIAGEDGNDSITILLQYRDKGIDGDAISIGEIGKVELDGEPIPEVSAKMSGIFYELNKPLSVITGKHHIVFTDLDKNTYEEEFDFQPFTLLTQVADTIQRGKLVFEFGGLKPEALMTVLMTDTSFVNEGINRAFTVRGGRLEITQHELENLSNGPVQLEFIKEEERSFNTGTGTGRRLLMIYRLKREFFLKN